MYFDSHVHVGPWNYFDTHGRTPTTYVDTLQELSRHGFSGAVVMPSELMSNEELLRQMQAAPGSPCRAHFFPWVRPGRGVDLEFLRRHEQSIHGLKIHPSLDKTRVDSESYQPFLDLAADNNWVVLVHCGAWKEMASVEFVLNVARRYARLQLICAHLGGGDYGQKLQSVATVAEFGSPQIFFEISGTHEFWLIEEAVSRYRPEKFLLGSDYPVRGIGYMKGVVEDCRLSPDVKQMISWGNARRLFEHA